MTKVSDKTVCPLCKNNVADFQEHWHEYEILDCRHCGLTYSSPMKAADGGFYEAHEEYKTKWEFHALERWTAERGMTGTYLDIACGDGKLLDLMRARFKATGLDFNPAAIKKVAAMGFEAHGISLEEFHTKQPGRTFNLVSAFHVLEHVPDPHIFLTQIKHLLTSDSVFAVAVPNTSRLSNIFFREIWDYPPHHLTRWPKKTLLHFLEEHGFEILTARTEPMRSWGQVKAFFEDATWSLVHRKLHFGIASQLEKPGAGTEDLRKGLRQFLIRAKETVIRISIFMATLLAYPFFLILKAQGKTLLVIARLKNPS